MLNGFVSIGLSPDKERYKVLEGNQNGRDVSSDSKILRLTTGVLICTGSGWRRHELNNGGFMYYICINEPKKNDEGECFRSYNNTYIFDLWL